MRRMTIAICCVVSFSAVGAAELNAVAAVPSATALAAVDATPKVPDVPPSWLGAVPSAAGDLQVAWLHDLAVVEPVPAPGWSEALRDAVPPDAAALLKGEDGSGAGHPRDDPETMASLIEAAALIAAAARTPARTARLRQLCCQLAAPAFDEILRLAAAQEHARVLVAIRPHVPYRDLSTERLTLTVPVPDARHLGAPLQFAFRDGVADYWTSMRDLEARERSVESYRAWRRDGEFAIEFPFRASPAMQQRVSLDLPDSTLGAVLLALGGQPGVTAIRCATELAGRPLSVRVQAVPLGDLLIAIARVTRTTVVAEPDGLRLTRPAEARDALLAAAPLGWWAWSQRTQYELESAREAWRLAFWRGLDPLTRQALEGGSQRLPDVAAPLRPALERLLDLRCGEAFKRFLLDLPDRDRVPLVLTGGQPRRNWFHLTAPGFDNLVGSVYSTALEQALHGGGPLAFSGPEEVGDAR